MVRRKFRNVQKKNKEAQKKKRMQIGISIFFVFLMIFSVMGIYVSQQQNGSLTNFNYDDYSFELQDRGDGQYLLVTQVDDKEIDFYSLPQDTLTIPTQGNITAAIGSTGYVAFAHNPTPETAQLVDLMRFDFDRYASVLAVSVPLLTNETQVDAINCLNATAQIPVITLTSSTQTEINVQENCVEIFAEPADLFLIRDRLLYSFTGIMDR